MKDLVVRSDSGACNTHPQHVVPQGSLSDLIRKWRLASDSPFLKHLSQLHYCSLKCPGSNKENLDFINCHCEGYGHAVARIENDHVVIFDGKLVLDTTEGFAGDPSAVLVYAGDPNFFTILELRLFQIHEHIVGRKRLRRNGGLWTPDRTLRTSYRNGIRNLNSLQK